MARVDSSAVSDVDYDPMTRRLTVRFTSGARYAYRHVPPEVNRRFIAAASKGRFFTRHVRDRYPFERLAGED